jgi:hypothetical protein
MHLRICVVLIVLFLSCVLIQTSGAQVITPVYSQDFESTSEFSLPTGWVQENWTDVIDGSFASGETTNLGNSMELEGWTVLNTDQLTTLGANRLSVPSVVSGKCVYAESDVRSGVQMQYLYTPIFDLRNQKSIIMRFDCNYTQNQDSIAFAEYTLQGNLSNDDSKKIWLPLFYWVNSTEVEAAVGGVEALMYDNMINDTADAYFAWIGADLSTIDFSTQIGGKIDDDQTSSKGRWDFELPKADGQQYIQIRFFQGGGGSWYFGIDNFVLGSLSEVQVQVPAKPSFTVSPLNPSVNDDVALTGSVFNSPSNLGLQKSEWQIAGDTNFANLLISTEIDDTTVTLLNKDLPMDVTLYARLRYVDDANQYSDYSDTVTFKLAPPAGTKRIFFEDFESTDEGSLPTDWKDVNFNDADGGVYTTWSVVTTETLTSYGSNRVDIPVFNGKSVYTESDRFGGLQDDHLFSKRYNLSGVKDVWVSFSSNYLQNQDNIAVLEYSVDGGDLNDSREPQGTWLPVLYYLDVADITYGADGTADATQTFRDENVADGTQFAYNYWVFAKPLSDLGPYIAAGRDDSKVNKSYLKFRLSSADKQSSVVLRWSNMGTGSWFWGLDDVAIYGNDGTGVSDWSLF